MPMNSRAYFYSAAYCISSRVILFVVCLVNVLCAGELDRVRPGGWISGSANVSIATCPVTMDFLANLSFAKKRTCESTYGPKMIRYFPSEVPELLSSLSLIGDSVLREEQSSQSNKKEDFVISVVGDTTTGLPYHASMACDSEYNLVTDYFLHRYQRRLRYDYNIHNDSMGFKKCGHLPFTDMGARQCIRDFYNREWIEQLMNSSSVIIIISSLGEGPASSMSDHLLYAIDTLDKKSRGYDDVLIGIINTPRDNGVCRFAAERNHLPFSKYFAKSAFAFSDFCAKEYQGYPLRPHCVPWVFKSGDTMISMVYRKVFHQLATISKYSARRKLSQKGVHGSVANRHHQHRGMHPAPLLLSMKDSLRFSSAPLFVDNSSLDYALIESRAKNIFERDPFTPIMMSVIDELLLRKSPEWFASREGLHITSGKQLKRRLDLARTRHSRDCRRDNALLLMCVITKNDDIDIQEWLVWQIIIVGAHHILVYVSIPMTDHTLEALRPFEEAGFVSVIKVEGSGKQPDVYDQCVKTIRQKICHYPGYGPLVGNGSETLKDCAPHEDPDMYNGKDRVVWLSAFDSDEFALSMDGACMIDELAKYNEYNGLMIPWFCMGHSQHFLTPKDKLVTEAYTHRMPGVGGLDKAFNRFYCIDRLPNSHVATFKNKKMAVDEFYEYSNYEQVGKYPAKHFKDELFEINATYPKYRLYHYMTKSVEHLVKKWNRGMADYKDQWGRSMKRPLDIIVGWLKGFATEWSSEDKSALEMSRIVRTVLYG